MSEYDIQFEADLERAQALSLESLALEQFRKQRSAGSASPTSELDMEGPLRPTRSRSGSATLPPALPPPPRRPARRARPPHPSHPSEVRSTSTSPTNGCQTENETNDLISFTRPASGGKAHLELKECIEHIHRLQHAEQLALVPVSKSGTKLSRSNSNISSYSTNNTPQNVIPYPSSNTSINNYVNPLIAFPTNNPYVQYNQFNQNQNAGTFQNTQNNLYPQLNTGANYNINNRTSTGYTASPGFVYQPSFNVSPLVYPNLSNVQSSAQPTFPPNNGMPLPARTANPINQSVLTPNSASYPQLNVFNNNSQSASSLNSIRQGVKTSPSAQNLSNASSGNNLMQDSKEPIFKSGTVQSVDTTTDSKRINTTSNASMWNMNQPTEEQKPNIYLASSSTKTSSESTNRTSSVSVHRDLFLSSGDSSSDFIDLGANTSSSNIGSVRVSVLEAFDPLMADQNSSEYMCGSECSGSVYEEYDPLDFLYGEQETPKDTPVYASISSRKGVGDSLPSPLPSPLPKAFPPPLTLRKKTNTVNSKLYECISFVSKRKFEPEMVAFLDMVRDVRVSYVHTDPTTNPGYVIAAKSEGKYPPNTSIKLLVYHDQPVNPITFTCDVESTVEHVIMHVVCELEGEIKEDMSAYTLRVWGMSEYLTPGSSLCEYDYVRQCVRLEKDILLSLQATQDTSLARTERDDTRDSHITMEELLPNQGLTPPISFQSLSILLETLERELSRLSTSVSEVGAGRTGSAAQAVKAICALLGAVETMQISRSLAHLISACSQSQPDSNIMKPEIITDTGDYCSVSLRQTTIRDTLGLHCQKLREAIKAFIAIYCKSNRVDFQIEDTVYSLPGENEKAMALSYVKETALFYIEGVHRPPVNWNHDEFVIHAQIYHGTRPLKGMQSTHLLPIDTTGFYPRIIFETWLNLDEVSIANLPKEARLVLTLTGRTLAKPDNQNGPTTEKEKDKAAEANQKESPEKQDDDDDNRAPVHIEQEELGWTAIQLFDYNGLLVSGSFILPIWPVCADKRLGPAPELTDCPPQLHPLLHIDIPSYCSGGVYFQEDEESEIYSSRHSFDALDKHTQLQLMHLVEQGPYQRIRTECREILWEKRHYLVGIPGALPLVLLASMNWDATSKRQLMHLLDQWAQPSPHDALHMLLPCFPDVGVRERAVRWLSHSPADLLTTLAPQLCLALRYERHPASPLARLLLQRALASPRFAHRLYWQLVHDIPGNSPQNSSEQFLGISLDGEPSMIGAEPDPSIVASARWVRRNQLLLRALLAIVGENLAERLLKQQLLVKALTEVASSVKNCKESVRNRTLQAGIENLAPLIKSHNICLPLSISQEVHDVDVKSCSYFPSNTLPLKINFVSSDNAIIPAIFKVGDDLRQDALVLQVMRVMDQLWLTEGLDLRMVTFNAVPTQLRKGMIEMVCSAETLRAIQVEWGLTGSFKDKPIAEWLAKHNPSELEYERAVTNFTASCAGYSVATYLLGICDRHNDNIMLKTSGHLFHIDFGKFLGDAQMFGNFKRDRTPFVLTPDMAYVINGGERPSQRFHHFVELCCTAFNIVRKHHNLILNLFSLMASSGISGVSAAAVGYVRAALLPGQTPAEAAAAFARMIHSALRSRFTPINFFLHNLAQLRAGDQSNSSTGLLSFMPKTYTISQEGRLTNVEVLGYEKRYDPEKYYVYALRIYRQGQATPFVLYRSYKHFTELYQKICIHFPLAKVHSLPVGLGMGRSNTKQAAERRFSDVQAFLTSLFSLADEIAHHDLVYTFFHPMLRDQQDVVPQRTKHKTENQQNIGGSEVGALKITIQYSAGVLSVLILHAQALPMTPQGVPPSPYVKVYLVPDPSKETKRKTRVLKKNCHPSFMEMLEYRLPLEVIRGRDLQATVWHHDPLQENQFLGGVQLPLHNMQLTTETTQWYPLQYIPR